MEARPTKCSRGSEGERKRDDREMIEEERKRWLSPSYRTASNRITGCYCVNPSPPFLTLPSKNAVKYRAEFLFSSDRDSLKIEMECELRFLFRHENFTIFLNKVRQNCYTNLNKRDLMDLINHDQCKKPSEI